MRVLRINQSIDSTAIRDRRLLVNDGQTRIGTCSVNNNTGPKNTVALQIDSVVSFLEPAEKRPGGKIAAKHRAVPVFPGTTKKHVRTHTHVWKSPIRRCSIVSLPHPLIDYVYDHDA